MIPGFVMRVTTADASRLFDVPVGTLRRWAHEDHWTPHGVPRYRRWEHPQVQASYDRRRAAAHQAS
ncbi:MAG: hypothetical protein ACRDQU_13105 [Pseudonocardiaceae bacterium]